MISVPFWNRRSGIYIHLTLWLVAVRRWEGSQGLNFSLRSVFFVLDTTICSSFSCKQLCAKLWMPSRKDCLKMCTIIPILYYISPIHLKCVFFYFCALKYLTLTILTHLCKVHVESSLGKILNPEPLPVAVSLVFECMWLFKLSSRWHECDMWFKSAIWITPSSFSHRLLNQVCMNVVLQSCCQLSSRVQTKWSWSWRMRSWCCSLPELLRWLPWSDSSSRSSSGYLLTF